MSEMALIDQEQRRELNQFHSNKGGGNGLVEVESSRAVAETQAAILLAKKFPRDQKEAVDRILMAFTRPTLAEKAEYAYARGGSEISGPSIRAAETIAQLWGNIQFGIRELTQANGASEVEAFAWDVETNTRQVKVFKVPHTRYSRSGGNQALTDPRDIYEMVANQGARRLRACILGIIPGDVTEAAMNQADATMKTKAEVTPERLQALLAKFSEYGVTQAMIEAKIQRRIDAMTPALLVQMGKVYNALRDGIAKVADHFEPTDNPNAPKATLKDRVTGKPATPAPTPEAPKDAELEKMGITVHDEPPAGAAGAAQVAGTPDPASGGAKTQPEPASAAGATPPVPFDNAMKHAKKAKTQAEIDIVRDLMNSPAYSQEQRDEIEVILKSKKPTE
jgi:hypothetical protein